MTNKKPKIIGLVESRMKSELKDAKIGINEQHSGSSIYGFISGTGFEYIIDEESEFKIGILPLRVTENIKYWFSVIFKLSPEKKTKSISISVFSDDSHTKLFRAEWTTNRSNLQHAQPHWHIHQNKRNNIVSWDEESGQSFPVVTVIDEYNPLQKLHFAMSSTWHNENLHVIPFPDKNDTYIINWVSGTIKYIISELKYLNS
jgi:hypothetical protein